MAEAMGRVDDGVSYSLDSRMASATASTTRASVPCRPQRPNYQTSTSSERETLPQHLSVPGISQIPGLPPYIKPLPIRFEQDDIIYLSNKGALTLPDEELDNELIRSYVDYMHPLMPLLDLHELLRAIAEGNGVVTISSLLHQAIMFTGTATVPMHLLKPAGYRTMREARRAFYNRTRLLYELDYENDSLALERLPRSRSPKAQELPLDDH